MLIIEIALGIVLAVLILANLGAILSLGLLAVFAIAGLGIVIFLLSSLPSVLMTFVQFIEDIPALIGSFFVFFPALLLTVLNGMAVVIGVALAAALSSNLFEAVFGVRGNSTVSFDDLSQARQYGSRLAFQVTLRYFAERITKGLIHFILLLIPICMLADYMQPKIEYTLTQSLILSSVIFSFVYVIIFVLRKFVIHLLEKKNSHVR